MKNKIYSRSVRMTAVNTREFETNSLGSNNTTLSNAGVKNYSGRNFSNVTDFSKISFKGANLKRAVFDNLDFEKGLNKNGEKLIYGGFKLDFSGADLTGASFYETTMPNANFQGATITTSSFDDAYLRGAIFSSSTITHTSFSSANLTKANFSSTIFNGEIDLSEANLSNANFIDAKFNDIVDFSYADFTEANFTNSFIIGTFSGAIFDGTIFNSATLQGSFQVGSKNKEKSKIFNNVKFRKAKLAQINFSYYPYEEIIILRNVDFTGASFSSNYDIFFDDDAKELAVKFENTTCPNGETTNNRC
jgi:uncharacterized protein YjbI with pentapeptide repeats